MVGTATTVSTASVAAAFLALAVWQAINLALPSDAIRGSLRALTAGSPTSILTAFLANAFGRAVNLALPFNTIRSILRTGATDAATSIITTFLSFALNRAANTIEAFRTHIAADAIAHFSTTLAEADAFKTFRVDWARSAGPTAPIISALLALAVRRAINLALPSDAIRGSLRALAAGSPTTVRAAFFVKALLRAAYIRRIRSVSGVPRICAAFTPTGCQQSKSNDKHDDRAMYRESHHVPSRAIASAN